LVAISTAFIATLAAAQSSTFRIAQVFSDMSGDTQFIDLVESAGLDGQHRLAGLTLTSTHNGIVKRFTFARDLPTDRTANMSIIVSARNPLQLGGPSIITFDTMPPTSTSNVYDADIPGLPARFIPTDGGTLDFAGVDQINYASLPSDGANALYRDGSVAEATVPANDHCHVRRLPCEGRQKFARDDATAIEYYNAALDHYFISASAPDIDALDSGRLAGWTRTNMYGAGFRVYPRPLSERDHPVCRFYMPPSDGDSHFFSASIDECESVRVRFPNFFLESRAAFFVKVPDPATGACPPPDNSEFYSVPVYRLWNQRPDSNHRYTDSEAIRDDDPAWLRERRRRHVLLGDDMGGLIQFPT
jgi:hypothetical protein